jgi:uncharacterized membrane protein
MSSESLEAATEGFAERDDSRVGQSVNPSALLGAVVFGAAAMYFLDPDRGRRRRHLVRDKLVHARREAGDAMGTTGRDLGNRARGAVAATRRRFGDDDADDETLRERVRSALGRATSHPGAIDVVVTQGRVTLAGPVLAREAEQVLATVSNVRGVDGVEDCLVRHETPGDLPALQGDAEIPRAKAELLQENWTPAVRLLAGLVGGAVAAEALAEDRRSNPLDAAVGLAGLALLVRSATNLPFDRLVGIGAGRRAIDVQKSINIAAPVDDVFNWLAAWERWPHWMTHVREVRSIGGGATSERTHWVVDGPAGKAVEWDAITTRFEPPSLIAWKTAEGASISHAGVIRLVPTDEGSTRVDVHIAYNPILGAAGHAVAALFGRDPKRQLDDDLARLKTTIETGIPPHDAAVRPSPERGAGMAARAERPKGPRP